MTDNNNPPNVLNPEASEKDFLQAIIENLPGHVYWLDKDNVYLGCNELQAKYFGLKSPEAIIGKNNYELYNKKDAEELNRINNSVMGTGITYYGEEIAISSTEGEVVCLSQKMPLHSQDGKVIGLLGISFDITDRKRAEALEGEKALMEVEEALRKRLLKVMHRKIQRVHKTIMDNIAHDLVYPLDNLITMIHCFCENMDKEKLELMDKNLNLILAAYERNRLYTYKTHIGKHYKTQIHRIQQSLCGVQELDWKCDVSQNR